MPEEKDYRLGRVIEVRRERYKVKTRTDEVDAVIKGSFYHGAQERSEFPAVGDYVLFRENEGGVAQIARVLERKSKFSRTDFSGHSADYVKTILEQVVAANFDYVFIFTSLNQDFSPGRIARYLSAAWESGGTPVVILTKSDLCEDVEGRLAEVESIAPGVDLIALSSKTGEGLDRVAQYLTLGKTIVFLGMSGVGKSSLLNALAGEELMVVREIREDDARGRHTTTHRQLITLNSGAMIIDTPGMRELGLWDAEQGIKAFFRDVEDLVQQCRFSDCTHLNEPGCAVREALEDGRLDPEQWKRYLKQRREAAFVQGKTEYLRSKDAFFKKLSIKSRK